MVRPGAYVGENWQSIKGRLYQHRRPSSLEYQRRYQKQTLLSVNTPKDQVHQINEEDVVVLHRGDQWFERGVREAIFQMLKSHP